MNKTLSDLELDKYYKAGAFVSQHYDEFSAPMYLKKSKNGKFEEPDWVKEEPNLAKFGVSRWFNGFDTLKDYYNALDSHYEEERQRKKRANDWASMPASKKKDFPSDLWESDKYQIIKDSYVKKLKKAGVSDDAASYIASEFTSAKELGGEHATKESLDSLFKKRQETSKFDSSFFDNDPETSPPAYEKYFKSKQEAYKELLESERKKSGVKR